MAQKCLRCSENVYRDMVQCPCCGATYHNYCWNYTDTCIYCGKVNKNSNSFKNRSDEEIQAILQQRAIAQQQAYQEACQEAERQRQETDARRLAEEQATQKAEQERYRARINHLKALGRDGYYEYKVISIVDKKGAVNIENLMATLNDLGLDGWRLQCAYTNEMGKDSLSIAGFGINATADQNILIFERFVKFE